MSLRSLLFVPGNRPDRFGKALAAGADIVCIDLEDAVPPAEKATARATVIDWLPQANAPHKVCVRINAPDSAAGGEDIQALTAAPARPAWVMVPKVAGAADILAVAKPLPQVRLIALIESPGGVLTSAASATASPQLGALMFGGADFSAETHCAMAWEPLLAARCQLAMAAHAAGLELIDMPYLDIQDTAGLARETQAVKSLGFTAKAALHPQQVDTINGVFAPDAEAVAWARAVIAAVDDDDTATAVVEGQFVDRPVIRRARRIVQLADRRDKT